MAIDELNEKRTNPGERSTPTGMIVVFIVLALLAVGAFYTLSKVNSVSGTVAIEAAKTRTDLNAKVDDQVAALERSNAQVLEGIKAEIDTSAKRVGMTQSALRRATASVSSVKVVGSRKPGLQVMNMSFLWPTRSPARSIVGS